LQNVGNQFFRVRQTYFEIHFKECNLDFSNFTLKLKGLHLDCSLLAVDFMSADLTGAVFDNLIYIVLNLKRRLPTKPTLEAVILYLIDPARTTQKHNFLTGLKGLLAKHDIIVQ
jgi:hypothetical protein